MTTRTKTNKENIEKQIQLFSPHLTLDKIVELYKLIKANKEEIHNLENERKLILQQIVNCQSQKAEKIEQTNKFIKEQISSEADISLLDELTRFKDLYQIHYQKLKTTENTIKELVIKKEFN